MDVHTILSYNLEQSQYISHRDAKVSLTPRIVDKYILAHKYILIYRFEPDALSPIELDVYSDTLSISPTILLNLYTSHRAEWTPTPPISP